MPSPDVKPAGQRRRCRHHLPGRGEAAPATSTSARRWGRAPGSAVSSGSRSRTSSAGASGASCSGSSARTSTTSPLSYTDPAIRESRISGTVSLFDSRAAVHRRRPRAERQQAGGQLQIGLPVPRLALHPALRLVLGLQRIRYSGGSADLRARFNCSDCSRSTLGVSVAARHPVRPAVRHRRLVRQRERRAQRRLPRRHRQLPEARSRRPLVRAARIAGRQAPQLGRRASSSCSA